MIGGRNAPSDGGPNTTICILVAAEAGPVATATVAAAAIRAVRAHWASDFMVVLP